MKERIKMLSPNSGMDQLIPNFFQPGFQEMTEEDSIELFEWLQGLTQSQFAYLETVVEG